MDTTCISYACKQFLASLYILSIASKCKPNCLVQSQCNSCCWQNNVCRTLCAEHNFLVYDLQVSTCRLHTGQGTKRLAISYLIAILLVLFQGDADCAVLASLATRCASNGTYRSLLRGKWQVTYFLHVACEGVHFTVGNKLPACNLSFVGGAEGDGETSTSGASTNGSIDASSSSLEALITT